MQQPEVQTQGKKRIPAYILVGFLGSGKTTVLSELVSWCLERGLTPGLIVNEFGEVSIDGEAIRQEGLAMTELTNGCICCTAGDELVPAMREMASRSDIDLILVEATGLADPADMLDELTDPLLWETVEVGGIISVLDSKRFVELSNDVEIARRQVIFADVLVMNKCDLIDEQWRGALESALPKLAPQARIFAAEGGIPYEGIETLLSHTRLIGQQRYGQHARPFIAEERQKQDHTHEKHEHHDHDHHQHGAAHESIHTCSFALDRPVEREHFERFLEQLPATAYRAKGFVTFTGSSETFVFQYVPGFVFIRAFSLQDRSLLRGVFIGLNLDKEGLAVQLQACLSPAIAQ
ncbi:MAG: GTP-binding protein [Ktedonobacteraceae bacterium]|nr:GTP-binding protein [Ktedonobacteraceae bacterium]